MKILAVDDERDALEILINAIEQIEAEADIHYFDRASKALEDVKKGFTPDVAFLDIEMPGISGMKLAVEIKNKSKNTNIVFVTGFSNYALEAYSMHASGYIMKPVSAEQVELELNNLRTTVKTVEKDNNLIQVQCFGNFEVFYHEIPVHFERSKSKEVFAYLVDKQGTMATPAEIAAIIWEEEEYDRSHQKQLQTILTGIQKSFSGIGVEYVIIKNKQGVMVDKTKIDCNLYKFLEGDVSVLNTYKGQYMYAYSWTELTVAYLERCSSGIVRGHRKNID